MTRLLALRSVVLGDFGDKLRDAGGVKFSGIRKLQEFVVCHKTVNEDVNAGALRV